jgi:hypothetical protein
MNVVRLIPVFVSSVLMAAHFSRSGPLILAVVSLGFPLILLVPRPWVARVVQLALLLGALEWVRATVAIALRRQSAGEPWTRMAVILGSVALVTALSALVFKMKALRERYSLSSFAALVGLPLLVAVSACDAPPPSPPEAQVYLAEIEEWQAARVRQLEQPDSWLTVVGLIWVEEGLTSIGSDPDNDVVFPGEDVPPRLGTLTWHDDTFLFQFDPAATARRPAEAADSIPLTVDSQGRPTVVTYGSLTWFLIERYGQIGIRLKDSEAEARLSFHELDSYPIDLAWRIAGRFDRYDPPREFPQPNVLGMPSTSNSPGAVVFEVDGEEYRLDVTGNPDGRQFSIVFGDETNGTETYGGGRFLSVGAPGDDGWVVVDFNRAYNPPCVFTAFATCPLPMRQNRLPVRIEAGEKMYHGAPH